MWSFTCVLTVAFTKNSLVGCDIHFITYGFDITHFFVVEFNNKTNVCVYFTLMDTSFDSLFKTIWHIDSACQIHSGEPAESTLRSLSVPTLLYSIIKI